MPRVLWVFEASKFEESGRRADSHVWPHLDAVLRAEVLEIRQLNRADAVADLRRY